jgi:hypothetical protein
MPNHVTNILTAPKEVLDFLKGEDGDVDFNTIVPMPECLNITEGSETDWGMSLITGEAPFGLSEEQFNEKIESYDEERIAKLKELGQQALDNREKLGHQSWYSWSCEYWGTKWNAYSVERFDDECVEFQTAWGCPVAFFEALSEKFPNVEIKVEYADEDIGSNCGTFTVKDGDFIEENLPDSCSKEAYELAFRICGGEDYYEYNEEEGTYEYVDED